MMVFEAYLNNDTRANRFFFVKSPIMTITQITSAWLQGPRRQEPTRERQKTTDGQLSYSRPSYTRPRATFVHLALKYFHDYFRFFYSLLCGDIPCVDFFSRVTRRSKKWTLNSANVRWILVTHFASCSTQFCLQGRSIFSRARQKTRRLRDILDELTYHWHILQRGETAFDFDLKSFCLSGEKGSG